MSETIKPIYLRGINPLNPTVYDDGLSYMESVAKLQSKINECINLINGLDVPSINAKLQELKDYVDNLATVLSDNVTESIANNQLWVNTKIEELQAEVDTKLSEQDIKIKIWVEKQIEELKRDVNLIFYSTVTGQLTDINTILKQMYNRLRVNALTASEYDVKELTAQEYDNTMLSAYSYDMNGAIELQ